MKTSISTKILKNKTAIDNWHVELEVDDKNIRPDRKELTKNKISFYFDNESLKMDGVFEYIDDRLMLNFTLENIGSVAVAVGKVYPFIARNISGWMPEDDIVVLASDSHQTHRVVMKVDSPDVLHVGQIKILFFNRTQTQALQFGFLGFRKCDSNASYEYDLKSGTHNFKAYCDFNGLKLEPGEKIDLETFTLVLGKNPHVQLVEWADLVAKKYSPKFVSEPCIGWLGMSWVDSYNGKENHEDATMANLDATNGRLNGFGVNYLWLSIANIEGGMPGDWLNWNSKNFPTPPKQLVANLEEKGFKLGLWCGPFYISSALTELVSELHDALLKKADGSFVVAVKKWRHGDVGLLPEEEWPDIYVLDPTHPKSLAYIKKVFEVYRSWGVRYCMVDFLGAGAGSFGAKSQYFQPIVGKNYDAKITSTEAYSKFMSVIREAAGPDFYLLASSGPTIHNTGHVDAVRTGCDFGEGRPRHKNAYFYPATFAINSMSFSMGAQRALANQAGNYYTHQRLYQNDSGNVLSVDKPISLEHARINATIHAMSGSSTMLGDDIRRIDESRLDLIKKTLPRATEVAFPVDLFEIGSEANPHVFMRKIVKKWGDWSVVAFYNFTEKSVTYEQSLSSLELDTKKQYLAWEFWNDEYLGNFSETLNISVPSYSVRVVRLTKACKHPVVLGTDMHLLMGEMDIEDVCWDADSLILSGYSTRPDGERGNIFVHAPSGFMVKNFDDCYVSRDARDNSLIIRIAVEGRQHWQLQFAPIDNSSDMHNTRLA
jgi:glycosyl hydrolase family 31